MLVDSSKFQSSSGAIVCSLDEVDVIITDDAVSEASVSMVERAGAKLIVAR